MVIRLGVGILCLNCSSLHNHIYHEPAQCQQEGVHVATILTRFLTLATLYVPEPLE
jgi:hypothetical protein